MSECLLTAHIGRISKGLHTAQDDATPLTLRVEPPLMADSQRAARRRMCQKALSPLPLSGGRLGLANGVVSRCPSGVPVLSRVGSSAP